MPDDSFNMSMRKYLKQVGVTSQQAIEAAMRERGEAGRRYAVRAEVVIEALGLRHAVEGEIEGPGPEAGPGGDAGGGGDAGPAAGQGSGQGSGQGAGRA